MRVLAALGLLIGPALTLAHHNSQSVSTEVASIESTTQQIRQLKQLVPVRVFFSSDRAFGAALVAQNHRDSPAAEIALAQRESLELGFLKPGDNLSRIIDGSLTGQVLGFYDYDLKRLYVRNSTNQLLGPGRYAIAHEYTHALQDQHYGLKKLLPDEWRLRYRNSDAISARHALTEGDAVTTQTLFIQRTYSAADVQALVKQQAGLRLPVLPTAIQREFDFAYDDTYGGVRFVSQLYQHGGMGAIDAAYRNLPNSTYVIMYPDAYRNGWRPSDVILHSVRGFSGWRQTDDDVFGAFGYHLLLWQSLPPSHRRQRYQNLPRRPLCFPRERKPGPHVMQVGMGHRCGGEHRQKGAIGGF